MIIRITGILLAAVLLVAASNQPALAQPAAPPQPTLWSFLGIPQGYQKAHDKLLNKRGNRPGLERKPPLVSLADPANLESGIPALQAAAEIKIAEDLAPQKIKAIKYLASIGCGCYDKDGKITLALLAAMAEDCTETVRLAAVQAISHAAQGEVCDHCSLRCCCDPKIVQQLAIIAYERDEFGCWIEPSQRVREAATEALSVCCPATGVPIVPEVVEPPVVDPDAIEPLEEPDLIEPLEPPSLPPAPPAPERSAAVSRVLGGRVIQAGNSSPLSNPRRATRPAASKTGQAAARCRGAVVQVDPAQSQVHVHFQPQQDAPPVGTRLKVFQRRQTGYVTAGELEVVASFPGAADVRPVAGTHLSRITPGDLVLGWR